MADTPASSIPVSVSHQHRGSLDPRTYEDWAALRLKGHQMLDDMFDYLQKRSASPTDTSTDDEGTEEAVWRPMPPQVRESFCTAPLPSQASDIGTVYDEFKESILPYVVGNTHPGFMGWVHGGGTPVGMLAEMLAGALNANCGGRDHSAIEVERQITRWLAGIFDFPEARASGLFVTGTSMANFLAVLIARQQALGASVRTRGLQAAEEEDGVAPLARLVAYTSEAAHTCIVRAMEYAGLGSHALRRIRVSESDNRIDAVALRQAIESDIAEGLMPFLIVGTAGSVGIGAVDDLDALATIAASRKIWFHVDGAFGALGILSEEIAPRLSGIQRADSIALDFHKWGQVQYDAGFVLVRDASAHRDTFVTAADYLSRTPRGLQKGEVWPNDLGPDLSRGFRALKTWFTLKVYGTRRIGEMITESCAIARYLGQRVQSEEAQELELMAPVQLNIVCFRYRYSGAEVDSINADIVMDVQESGIAAPSTLRIKGCLVIRAAIFNHRTGQRDVDKLLSAVLKFGRKRVNDLQTKEK